MVQAKCAQSREGKFALLTDLTDLNSHSSANPSDWSCGLSAGRWALGCVHSVLQPPPAEVCVHSKACRNCFKAVHGSWTSYWHPIIWLNIMQTDTIGVQRERVVSLKTTLHA